MKSHVPGFVFLLLTSALFAQDNVFKALNLIRGERGLKELCQDPLLARTAGRYAETLIGSNRLYHRGPVHGTALDRLRAGGGTASIVGEIIGAGPEPDSVLEAWQNSRNHLELILKPGWTHMGVGFCSRLDRKVWVVLFSIYRVENLSIVKEEEGYSLTGTFLTAEAGAPVLLAGVSILEPRLWDVQGRSFRYLIPYSAAGLYHRLGYISTRGELIITDVFYPDRLATFLQELEPR
ncbi:hypothetical protein ES703_56083 [subsurface metagenome]